ncbi:unnamed protein product [Didymodactylos carnosus]|uniref:Uncharacterized protein n=2 Tax=Didymodactylos carnosus TaxID=1234261 RepID=A0A813Z340_9BILA|nr:unnamed protein product [Didymodactylos carnosus]CAF3676701.1 unnamed protein product [Didymodactylos carnosus]
MPESDKILSEPRRIMMESWCPNSVSDDVGSERVLNWFDEVQKAKEQKRQPSLWRATVKLMGFRPLLIGLWFIPYKLLRTINPLLLAFLLPYFLPCTTMSALTAWLLATGIVFCSASSSVLYHSFFYRMQQCSMQLRIAYTGIIYKKLLRLSSQSMNKTSTGQITNLLSNDANLIETALLFMNFLWMSPLGIVFVVITLWYFVRYIAFIPVGYTLALLCWQFVAGRLFVKIRSKILQTIDERLKVMSEIIRSMRIVKMYCWEASFEHKIKDVRKREIIRYSYRLILDCVQTLFIHTYVDMAFLLMYGTMWYLNMAFDTKYFAVAYCLLAYLKWSVAEVFSYAVRNLVEYLSARKRIETFLLLSESERDVRIRSLSSVQTVLFDNSYMLASDCKKQSESSSIYCDLKVAKWETDVPFTLKNIEINAQSGDIIAVIGPVGSGKKARVNMARALYQDADIYLLDDPLSAVDVKVGKHLFEECIKGYLKCKVCILVTHQIQYLKDATKIIVLNNGEAVAQGTYEELLKSSISFAKLLEDIHQHEINTPDGDEKNKLNLSIDDLDKRTENDLLLRTQSSRTSRDETQNNHQPTETKATGVVKWHVFLDYFRASASLILVFLLMFIVFTSQQAIAVFSNWWSNEEQLRHEHPNGTCGSKFKSQIHSMSNNEWELYRNKKFYIYSGTVAVLFIITLIRVISTEFLCINAARILHNR